jgi:hypothetical protein
MRWVTFYSVTKHTLGEFKNDKRTGRGVFHRANGERYEGEFKDGKRHGVGVSYVPTNEEVKKTPLNHLPQLSCSGADLRGWVDGMITQGREKIYREEWVDGSLISKYEIGPEVPLPPPPRIDWGGELTS